MVHPVGVVEVIDSQAPGREADDPGMVPAGVVAAYSAQSHSEACGRIKQREIPGQELTIQGYVERRCHCMMGRSLYISLGLNYAEILAELGESLRGVTKPRSERKTVLRRLRCLRRNSSGAASSSSARVSLATS